MEPLKRILLVEDDPKDIELTLSALSEHNLAIIIVIAWNGIMAFDYLYHQDEFADRPEVNPIIILLDLKDAKNGWYSGFTVAKDR